jgi:Holliday junction resolvase RusA-like endonuclease
MSVDFTAAGMPSTKGSARAFVVGKRAIITNDAGQKAKAWAAIVSGAASDAMRGREMFDGPVRVEVTFTLPRPKAHFGSRGLRADAPTFVAKKPDGDKLARCALDALTFVVFKDDAQIAELVVRKVYGSAVGARFVVEGLVEKAVAATRAAEWIDMGLVPGAVG